MVRRLRRVRHLGGAAVGDFLAANLPVTDTALPSLIVPLGLVGVGFSFCVSSITATAVNTVPVPLAGMASATTSLLRDFGFTLGPAAVAQSSAGSQFATRLAGSSLSPAVKSAAGQVALAGGPLAVNSLAPNTLPGQAGPLAMTALGHGCAIGYVVCGCAALACCLLTLIALRGGTSDEALGASGESAAVPVSRLSRAEEIKALPPRFRGRAQSAAPPRGWDSQACPVRSLATVLVAQQSSNARWSRSTGVLPSVTVHEAPPYTTSWMPSLDGPRGFSRAETSRRCAAPVGGPQLRSTCTPGRATRPVMRPAGKESGKDGSSVILPSWLWTKHSATAATYPKLPSTWNGGCAARKLG